MARCGACPRPTSASTRLSHVSATQVVEPEETFDWDSLGRGRVLPDDLLSIAGLGVDLGEAERARLSREELASMLASGIRFEAILEAAFAVELAETRRLGDPRHTYMLHEIAEESRHQRAFLRLHERLAPRARNPFDARVPRFVARRVTRLLLRRRALFCVMLLAGEEIPDLLQKIASEHPGTDPLVRAVNRYHRQEEARHLAFARAVFEERWALSGPVERWQVRHLAPVLVRMLFDTMLHPGVYETVGLPGFRTWRAANRTPGRLAVRYRATRPILDVLCRHGALSRGRIPRAWRSLCGVDRHGDPLPGDPPLPGAGAPAVA
ncbi:MAG: hypothetical protein KatS3mg010_0475 [Acidimicrobiia bacterium]|nr:MAG: hypothetical protein KatS3mg010_0475 [Acidimicrobiia bacterium]